MFPLFPLCWVFFIINGCCTLSNAFFHVYWYDHVIFAFHFVYDVLHLLICKYCTPLHPWSESHLIMVYDFFNILLDLVCQYFVEDFSVYVHQWYWPIVFFLCCIFIWFWDWDDAGLKKRVWESSLFLDFLDSWRKMGISCSLGENLKSLKWKGESYLQRRSHKTISWLLKRNFAGKKGLARSIQSYEKQRPTS